MDETQTLELPVATESRDSASCRWLLFALAVAIGFADDLVLDLADWFRHWAELPRLSEWNWLGKAANIAFSCSLLVAWPWLRRNVGLRWRQAPGSARFALGCFIAYMTCAVGIGCLMPPTPFSADTLAYQLVMPGLAEELAIRGILLAILERACGQSPMSNRLRFGYASAITCLLFGLGHGLSTVDGHYQFAFVPFATTTLWAVPATLVRTRTGSLLWPVVYHGVWNFTIFLMAMMRW